MTTLAVTSVSSFRCQASTCLRIGSKLRCIRSTPTEMQSMRENDFECFASTGVNATETTSPNSEQAKLKLVMLASQGNQGAKDFLNKMFPDDVKKPASSEGCMPFLTWIRHNALTY